MEYGPRAVPARAWRLSGLPEESCDRLHGRRPSRVRERSTRRGPPSTFFFTGTCAWPPMRIIVPKPVIYVSRSRFPHRPLQRDRPHRRGGHGWQEQVRRQPCRGRMMKSLLHPDDMRDVERRLKTLQPESDARWGRMSSHQAVCHLSRCVQSGPRGAHDGRAQPPRCEDGVPRRVVDAAHRLDEERPDCSPRLIRNAAGPRPQSFRRTWTNSRCSSTAFLMRSSVGWTPTRF